jgi:hypothetical protein
MVVLAVDEQEPTSWEDVTLYTRIADRIRALARRHDLALRIVDRALWTWAKMIRDR